MKKTSNNVKGPMNLEVTNCRHKINPKAQENVVSVKIMN